MLLTNLIFKCNFISPRVASIFSFLGQRSWLSTLSDSTYYSHAGCFVWYPFSSTIFVISSDNLPAKPLVLDEHCRLMACLLHSFHSIPLSSKDVQPQWEWAGLQEVKMPQRSFPHHRTTGHKTFYHIKFLKCVLCPFTLSTKTTTNRMAPNTQPSKN
jgi:hypothetical protein